MSLEQMEWAERKGIDLRYYKYKKQTITKVFFEHKDCGNITHRNKDVKGWRF